MATAIAKDSTKQVARPPRVLIPLIQKDLEQGDKAAQSAGMPFYRAAGEKLIEAKSQMERGTFGPWVKRNFSVSHSQLVLYMSLARATEGSDNDAAADFSSIKDFRRRHLGHDLPTHGGGLRKPSWQVDVKENIERARRDMERIREEDLTRKQERDAESKLALRLIDIGYKILAKELHPDSGGSRDAMQRLVRVRDRLKASA